MYKILVVEDDELILNMIKINLERKNYEVTVFRDAENMFRCIQREYFDLMLLDIMLPGMHGDEVLKKIREQNINIPVIMVTAKNDVSSKINSLDYGADDYITKPFNITELLARVKANIRRSQGKRVIPSHCILKIGSYEVNFQKRTASSNTGNITLSEKEINLLILFHQHIGETLRRIDILDEVWGMDSDPTPRTIDNYIVKFRKLFEEDPEKPKHFITVHSTGYCFLP